MSDPGLDADLTLDIRTALNEVSRLEEAATRALSDVRMTVDARAVTAGIDAAVLNADTGVVIVGDAAELTGDITAAVDAADTAVVVTGSAQELTGDVTAAVDAADTTVTVTGSVDSSLRQSVQGLDDDLTDAASSAGALRASVAALSAGAVVAGLYQMAQAASDFGESSSKAATVFGDSFTEISQFSKDAATAVGLSETAALEATGTFGNLFQALGATQDVAADLSPQVVTLAGDLASFNNLGIEETLEKLRSGLVGEVEPLRGLGVSFNAAQVEAKAFELGLANVGEEVSEGAKLQARFALIMEQTTLAQGDFARTSGGLANQQRILNAEFQNAVTTAGQALLPVLLDLVSVARTDMLPAFTSLATDVLPPFASILVDLAPLLGNTAQLLTLLGPPLAVMASAVDAIPAPLIAAAGALVLLNKASDLSLVRTAVTTIQTLVAGVQSLAATKGVSTAAASLGVLQSSAGALGASLATATLTLAPLAVGIAAVISHVNQAAERKRQLQKVTQDVTKALTDEEGVIRSGTGALADYIDTTSFFSSANEKLRPILDDVGLSAQEMARLVQAGSKGQEEFARRLEETGNAGGLMGDLLRDQFGNLQKASDSAAKAGIEQARSTGAISDAQAKAALSSDDLDGALRRLQGDIDAHNASMDAATERYGPQIAAAEQLGGAYEALSVENRGLADELVNFREEGVENDAQLTKFILSLQQAALSEAEMGSAAALLGTDAEHLGTLLDGTRQAVDALVDAVISGLPGVEDAFADTTSVTAFVDNLRTSTADVGQFMADLQAIFEAGGQDIAAILGQLGLEGGASYARELAASIGPGGSSPLVTETEVAVDAHNAALGKAEVFLREQFGPAYIASTGLVASLASEALGENLTFAERTRIAANLAGSTLDEEGRAIALIAATEGREAAEAYASLFKIDGATLAEGVAAGATLSGPVAASIGTGATSAATAGVTGFEATWAGLTPAAVAGVDAAASAVTGTASTVRGAAAAAATGGITGWEDTWSKASGIATGAVDKASGGIRGTAGQLRDSAAHAGGAATAGFRGEVEPGFRSAAEAGKSAAGQAINQTASLSGAALAAGVTVGSALSSGIASGIGSSASIQAIRNAAARAVREGEAAARAEAQSHSPSLLFARLGRDLGLGTALGLEQTIPDIVSQAEAVVRESFQAAVGAVNAGGGDLAAALQHLANGDAVGFGIALDTGRPGPSREKEFTELGRQTLALAESLRHLREEGTENATQTRAYIARVADQAQALAASFAAASGVPAGPLVQVDLGGMTFHGAITPEQAARVAEAATAAAMATATDKAKALRVLAAELRAQGASTR